MAAAAAQAVRRHKANKQKADDDIQSVFEKYDTDRNGNIDPRELQAALYDLGMSVTDEQLGRIMNKYDSSHVNNSLTVDEFDTLVSDMRGSPRQGARSPANALESTPARNPGLFVKICQPTWELPMQRQVWAFYNHPLVVFLVASAIVGNFLVNILEKEFDPRGTLYREHPLCAELESCGLWENLDLAFNIIFLVELLVNMYAAGGPFWPFWNSAWNVFDFIIVTVGVILMTGMDLGELNKLKLLRAFRVFRLFKRVKSLNQIIVALVRSIPGVLNAFVVLLIVFIVYAILAVELFIDFGADGTFVTYDEFGNYTNVAVTARGYTIGYEYYGTFSRALYTLFQVFTGESWSEAVARPLLFGMFKANAWFVASFFVSFLLITQIVLANVVVAVLLDKFVGEADPPGGETDAEPKSVDALLDGTRAPDPATKATFTDASSSGSGGKVTPRGIDSTASWSTSSANQGAKRESPSDRSGETITKLDLVLQGLSSLTQEVATLQKDMQACRAEIDALRMVPPKAKEPEKTKFVV